MKQQDQNEKLLKVLSIMDELEARKALYEELDRLTLELQQEGFEGTELQGLFVEIVDNFAEGKNTAWRAAGVKRFEVRTEPIEKRRARAEKQARKAAREAAREVGKVGES